MTQFALLQREWPAVFEAAGRAEEAGRDKPRAACFYARRALELAVSWVFKHDPTLKIPYQDSLSALVHEPTFKQATGEMIFTKMKIIITLGNRAVSRAGAIPADDAVAAVRGLFQVCYWLAHTYARTARPPASLRLDPTALPAPHPVPQQSLEALEQLQTSLAKRDRSSPRCWPIAMHWTTSSSGSAPRWAGRGRRRRHSPTPTTTPKRKPATTSSTFCSGRPGGRSTRSATGVRVAGMPNNQNKGFVDYVLWGGDGKPLGLVEASAPGAIRGGQQQAKLYADCLEQEFGQRPVIFYSNGDDHWIWDDAWYPPRGAGVLHERRAGAADSAAHQQENRWRRRRSTRRSWSGTIRRGPFGEWANRSAGP